MSSLFFQAEFWKKTKSSITGLTGFVWPLVSSPNLAVSIMFDLPLPYTFITVTFSGANDYYPTLPQITKYTVKEEKLSKP